jgi:hypothetical protein
MDACVFVSTLSSLDTVHTDSSEVADSEQPGRVGEAEALRGGAEAHAAEQSGGAFPGTWCAPQGAWGLAATVDSEGVAAELQALNSCLIWHIIGVWQVRTEYGGPFLFFSYPGLFFTNNKRERDNFRETNPVVDFLCPSAMPSKTTAL